MCIEREGGIREGYFDYQDRTCKIKQRRRRVPAHRRPRGLHELRSPRQPRPGVCVCVYTLNGRATGRRFCAAPSLYAAPLHLCGAAAFMRHRCCYAAPPHKNAAPPLLCGATAFMRCRRFSAAPPLVCGAAACLRRRKTAGRRRRRRRRRLCAPVRLVGCGSAAQRPRGVRRGARWGYAPPGPHPPLRLHRAPGRPVFGDDAARFGCRSKALNARLLRRYLQVARHGARA